MNKWLFARGMALACLSLLLVFAGVARATTYNELADIYDSQLAGGGTAIIDGKTVTLTESTLPGSVEIWVDGQFVGIALDNRDAILQFLATALDILLASAGSLANSLAAADFTSWLVFSELIVPTVKTTTEKNRQAARKEQGGVRTFGGSVRFEWVDKGADENGRITGFNLGLAYDVDDYTFGVILPYDYFDFDSFTANRTGAILFGQYHLGLSEELEATFTANLNYVFTDFRIFGENYDLDTYGGGLSAGLRYSRETYEVGGGVSYQYSLDDVDTADDHQHLFKVGGNYGYRMTPDQVINLFATWNYDATDYKYDYGDSDYFEVGAEYRANFSETWALNLGYRKVVDLSDYDSDMLYLGSAWQF